MCMVPRKGGVLVTNCGVCSTFAAYLQCSTVRNVAYLCVDGDYGELQLFTNVRRWVQQ